MAGDWLKFESNLPEKPETLAITAAMGWDDPDTTVGKLMRLFRWFDQHTTNGNARGVTSALLDRLIGVSGFAQSVADCGWLVISGDGVTLKNFDKHNGNSAKSRAQTAKRVALFKSNAKGNADTVTESVSDALPREEKRREENISSKDVVVPQAEPTKSKRNCKIPADFDLTADRVNSAVTYWKTKNRPDLDPAGEFQKFINHFTANGKRMADWDACWRTWYTNAVAFNKPAFGVMDYENPRTAAEHRLAVSRHTTDYKLATDF